MASHNDLGNHGEKLAYEYLIQKEYEILHTNWRYQRAEIDIIAKKNEILFIIEVKTRATDYFGKPAEFVSLQKQKLLIKAANAYIETYDLDIEAQFTIVSIIIKKSKVDIEMIEEAFYP